MYFSSHLIQYGTSCLGKEPVAALYPKSWLCSAYVILHALFQEVSYCIVGEPVPTKLYSGYSATCSISLFYRPGWWYYPSLKYIPNAFLSIISFCSSSVSLSIACFSVSAYSYTEAMGEISVPSSIWEAPKI